jgi:hypothetical protein
MVHGPLHPYVRPPWAASPKLPATVQVEKTYTVNRRDATGAAALWDLMRSGT